MAGAPVSPISTLLMISGASTKSINNAATHPGDVSSFHQGRRVFRRVSVSRSLRQPRALAATTSPPPSFANGAGLGMGLGLGLSLGRVHTTSTATTTTTNNNNADTLMVTRAFWSDAMEGYLGEETELPQDPLSRLLRFVKRSVAGFGKGKSGTILEQVFLYAVYAAVSCLVHLIGLRYMDPHRMDMKKGAASRKELSKRLNREIKETNMYEDIIAGNVINPDGIDVTFDSIGGLEDVKDSLHELVILPLQRPELFSVGKLLRPQKGVLLYGPPGTGKTLLAKALAKEAKAVFINVQTATLMSKWLGDAQKLVSAVFTLAQKLQPAIIFIDEVDSVLDRRGKGGSHEIMSQVKTEFMAQWDGLTTDQNARILVLAATNRPWDLDEAILRRLPRAFEIGMPDAKQRASILNVLLKGERVEEDVDVELLAKLSEGCSGSDLTELCKQAAYLPIRDLLHQEKNGLASGKVPRPLRQSDFESILRNARSSKDAAFEYRNRKNYEPSPESARENIPVFDFPFCN